MFDLTDEQKVEGANEIKLEEMRVRMVRPVMDPLCTLSIGSRHVQLEEMPVRMVRPVMDALCTLSTGYLQVQLEEMCVRMVSTVTHGGWPLCRRPPSGGPHP